jgi:hypothetical protein
MQVQAHPSIADIPEAKLVRVTGNARMARESPQYPWVS